MYKFNFLILVISSFIPIITYQLWYNPSLLGKIWKLNSSNFETNNKRYSIWVTIFILSFLYSIAMSYQVIHQLHFQSMLYNEVGFLKGEGTAFKDFEYINASYKTSFRTFKHGMFHGLLNSIFIVLPVLAISSFSSLKSWKEIMIDWGYWAICGIFMGGVICQFY